jgi:hypothetical protein
MDIGVQVHDLNESLEEVQAAVSAAKTGRNHSISFQGRSHVVLQCV